MRLLFMRHAETEINHLKSDINRDLTLEGIAQAGRAASFLTKHKIDKIIVSFVKRTIQTIDILQEINEISNVEIVSELYEGREDDVINLLQTQDKISQNILVIGHNPTIFLTILELIDPSTKEYEMLVQSAMTPAKIIIIDFPILNDWQDLRANAGNIIEIFTA